jgi:hypothetical protein
VSKYLCGKFLVEVYMYYRDITGHSIFENTGRIVRGVNTTVDIGEDEIIKQAAKFGFTVDRDGQPPLIDGSRPARKKPPQPVPKRDGVTRDYPENKE